MRIKFLALSLMLSSALAMAQSTLTVNMGTGLSGSGSTLSPGISDGNWTVKVPGSSTFVSAWVSNDTARDPLSGSYIVYYNRMDSLGYVCGNHYITPYIISTPGPYFGSIGGTYTTTPTYSNTTPIGIYHYKRTFTGYNCTPTSASLNLTVGVDNLVDSISINGHMYNMTSYNLNYWTYPAPKFSLPISTSHLVSGTNTVLIYVKNLSGPTCLYTCGDLTINYASDANLVPTFSGPSTFCAGAPLSFTWNDGSSVSTNYYWEILECNSSGVITSGGFAWNSWYSGSAPGTYTFPSTIGIPCGKYYKVKLAVQNQCDSWKETTKVIYINCLPTANAGPDVTICSGDCTDIGTLSPPARNTTYQWMGPGGSVGNTPSIVVCPTSSPITYTLTATNTVTGCSATDMVTVTSVINDASFSLGISTVNPSYFTVQATANYPYGYSTTGFYYDLKIQEMNGSTPYYTDNGTNEWWDYYVHEFRGYVSTGTGTYTQVGWWPATPSAPGQFLYGHTYKIIRTTWNDYCPQQTSYITITPVRSLSTGETTMAVISENGEIPAGVVLLDPTVINELSAKNNVSVYPNPTTGTFTVETDNMSASSIEVYDALGKKVKAMEQNSFKTVIDLTGFPKGIYMVNIISDGTKTSKKIVLE